MSKFKILICTVVAFMALTACTVEDNPTPNPVYEDNDSTSVNIDDPNESVTDRPAYTPGR